MVNSVSHVIQYLFPVNGEWSSWGTWANVGSCSASCAPGGLQNQERTRVCDNPPPSNGGATCPGSDTDTQQLTCNTQACPGMIRVYNLVLFIRL